MFKNPDWYARNATIPLYRLKKRTPPVVWVGLFLVACFALPFAGAIQIVHPGTFATVQKGFEIAQKSPVDGLLFTWIFLVYGSLLMFFANGAFVFLRAAAGYDVRRNASLVQWILNKLNSVRRK
ncbi:hypothetical protein [Roseateles flavus]|uniref:ABC transporter ATP-binding protein n=1 Tax=Roseateles flavus TaxID=3149041 RepID=A0ABV0GG85_9BURK